MGLFDDIKAKGAAYRLTEEAMYAEASREIESGQRRDGLWAKAMSESDMDQGKAGARYIKLRVQSLRDEITVLMAEAKGKSESAVAQLPPPQKPSPTYIPPPSIEIPVHTFLVVCGLFLGAIFFFTSDIKISWWLLAPIAIGLVAIYIYYLKVSKEIGEWID